MRTPFHIPIKYKFLGVLLFIVLGALAVFFSFAYKTFSEDKKLFVMDLNLTTLKAATSEIKLELRGRLEEFQILLPRIYQPQPGQENLSDPFAGISSKLPEELLGVTFYKRDAAKKLTIAKEFKNSSLFKKKDLPDNLESLINQKNPLDLTNPSDQSMELVNRSLEVKGVSGASVPLAVLSVILSGNFINDQDSDVVIVVDIIQDFLRNKLQQTEMSELFLISKKGLLLSHASLDPIIKFAGKPYPHPIVDRLRQKQFPHESLEININNEAYLANLSETGFSDLVAVSQVQKRQAFIALTTLLEKSALVAVFIVAIAVIVSILFAASLTANIQKLKQAAEHIGTGNFDVKLSIESNDEIENVAESFQWMAQKMTELISETASKARMEDELETARLVQSTLLTTPEIDTQTVVVESHYSPASECGGDFWDAYLTGHTLTLFIGDATGHGAPAAIVTAVAKSCFSTLNAIYQGQPLTPEQFLSTLNKIIYSSCRGQLLMTMCIAQIDLKTGKMTVCNGGHESPICLRNTALEENSDPTQKKKKPKTEVIFSRGERLGFDPNTEYESVTEQLKSGDTILLYTDGISEAHDKEGAEWGERALKKAFAGEGTRSLDLIKEDLVKGVEAHMNGRTPDDDITFVLLTYRGDAKTKRPPRLPGKPFTRLEETNTSIEVKKISEPPATPSFNRPAAATSNTSVSKIENSTGVSTEVAKDIVAVAPPVLNEIAESTKSQPIERPAADPSPTAKEWELHELEYDLKVPNSDEEPEAA